MLSPDPGRISDAQRESAAAAYSTAAALTAGFNWYRTFPVDARANAADTTPVETPLLYLRGARESGDIAAYVEGFRRAGVRHVESALIPDTGHFPMLEAPAAVWQALRA